VCAAELTEQGVRIRRTFRGGVEFGASDRQLYTANLWTRTATRIVVRVAAFTASSFAELDAALAEVAWEHWMAPGTQPSVRVSSTASRLYHTGAVAERVAASMGTVPGEGPLVVLRLVHDRVMVSVDSSGEPLHRRGWRLQTAKAPLRETLAAAAVLAGGWDATAPLVDPFCGSGTIAIEAALIAAGRPPGGGRPFAFQSWPSFAPGTWASVVGAPRTPGPPPSPIVAADRDAGAVEATRANAARAGVASLVEARRASVSELVPPPGGPGWLVTNPPYGRRTGGGDLRDLYARLGAVVSERFGGWHVGLLADGRLAASTGLALSPAFSTDNGGIPVRLLTGGPRPPGSPVRSGGDGPVDRRRVGERRAPR
jgi:putative N6-adenine-specific DNA methylase